MAEELLTQFLIEAVLLCMFGGLTGVDEERRAIDAAKQKLDATKQRVAADLDVALRKSETAETRVELAARSLAIAPRRLDAETQLFETGSATALAVREAEDRVRSAELRGARASVDRANADVQITHLTGRLLSEYAH